MTATYTIGDMLHQTMAAMGDETPKRYGDLFPYAIDFARELSRSTDHEVKSVVLTIGSDRVATLPEDYVDFVALARPVIPPDGKAPWLRNMLFNAKLSVFPAELLTTNNDEDDPWADEAPAAALPAYTYAGWVSPSMGTGFAPVGYGSAPTDRGAFTIDTARGVVLVDATQNPGECVLQYISDKTRCGHKTPIPYDALTAGKYYCMWQYYLMRGKLTEAREFERLYAPAMMKAMRRLQPLGLYELAAAVKHGQTMVK